MHKYNILLIDDEIRSIQNRREVFEAILENKWENYIVSFFRNFKGLQLNDDQKKQILKIFDNASNAFSVDYFDNVSEDFIREIEHSKKKYDAIFLDVIFDKAPEKTEFTDVLYAIRRCFEEIPPIFVYSGSIQANIINVVNDGFYKTFGDRTPCRYFLFSKIQEIVKATMDNDKEDDFSLLENWRDTIRKIISKSKGEVTFTPYKDNEVSVLHISDLQFGDKNTSDSLNGICNKIASNVKEVDILIITGDIAMNGLQSEFDEAKEFIDRLRGKLWPEASEQEKRERTIVVPGNHDFDLRMSVLDFFSARNKRDKYGNTIRQVDIEKIIEQLKAVDIAESKRNMFGLQAYRNFAYSITQRIEYLESSLDFVDARFLNWGICFYCLNSVGNITAEETNKVMLADNSDSMLAVDDALSVILCHHTPLCSAPKEIAEIDIEKFKKALYGYLTGNNCKILMGGHRHKSSSESRELKDNQNYHICEAASLRVEGDEKDYIRGYNKYILTRVDDVFYSIKERIYKISETDTTTTYDEETYILDGKKI